MMRASEPSIGRSEMKALVLLVLAVCLLLLAGPGCAIVSADLSTSAVAPEAIEHSSTSQCYDGVARIGRRGVHAQGDDARGAYDVVGHPHRNVVACLGSQSSQTPLACSAAAKGGRGLGAKAPDPVTPGVRQLDGQYVDDVGQVQPWRAQYDEYGRQVERTEFTGLPDPSRHTNPHHHTRDYGPGYGPKGKETQHPGPGPNTGGGQ